MGKNNEYNTVELDNNNTVYQQIPQQQQPTVGNTAYGSFQVPVQAPSTCILPQQVMYVYAPQGCYIVPGNANLLAIPQGQSVPGQGAPMQQQFFSPLNNLGQYAVPDQQKLTKNCKKAKKHAVTVLVTFLVGFFTYACYIASIAVSLHMVRKGYIVKRQAAVIAFSILEMIAWAFVASFVWYSDYQCSPYYDYYGNYIWNCYTMWWGWISIVVWGVFALCFGIPRVIFSWHYDAKPLH